MVIFYLCWKIYIIENELKLKFNKKVLKVGNLLKLYFYDYSLYYIYDTV